ncbi:GNAT family N-acetyltransferase [Kitasatospora sp. LaBMicrA B282]|uniref:GNAT family N-acetyltransferase n=1 Tax=Kitasatospora sp. LaBMicrA B282 TaxID=3420949 RepID=UPI003D0ED7C5
MTDSELIIRPATVAEIPTLLAFWAAAAEGTSITDDPAGLARLLDRDPEALLVATRGTALVGTVIAGWDGWRASVYRLAVDPAHRRQGIGGALMAAAEQRFAALGGRRVDAMVLERNAQGQAAWRSAGYRREEQWRRWVKPLAAGTTPAAG